MPSNHSGDLLVFSHLRWEMVFPRPQHLMMRAARDRRVYFFEAPLPGAIAPSLCRRHAAPNTTIVTPHLPDGLSMSETAGAQRMLLDTWMARSQVLSSTLWYDTLVARDFSAHLCASTIVYDWMNELADFSSALIAVRAPAQQRMARADAVFTARAFRHDAMRSLRANVHAMPSSVDLDPGLERGAVRS